MGRHKLQISDDERIKRYLTSQKNYREQHFEEIKVKKHRNICFKNVVEKLIKYLEEMKAWNDSIKEGEGKEKITLDFATYERLSRLYLSLLV
jgi:PP-loop superfamily ATP-utilizing enzyme